MNKAVIMDPGPVHNTFGLYDGSSYFDVGNLWTNKSGITR